MRSLYESILSSTNSGKISIIRSYIDKVTEKPDRYNINIDGNEVNISKSSFMDILNINIVPDVPSFIQLNKFDKLSVWVNNAQLLKGSQMPKDCDDLHLHFYKTTSYTDEMNVIIRNKTFSLSTSEGLTHIGDIHIDFKGSIANPFPIHLPVNDDWGTLSLVDANKIKLDRTNLSIGELKHIHSSNAEVLNIKDTPAARMMLRQYKNKGMNDYSDELNNYCKYIIETMPSVVLIVVSPKKGFIKTSKGWKYGSF